MPGEQPLKQRPATLERLGEHPPPLDLEDIERHEMRRERLRERPNPPQGRSRPTSLERPEVHHPVAAQHQQLAIEDQAGRKLNRGCHQIGKPVLDGRSLPGLEQEWASRRTDVNASTRYPSHFRSIASPPRSAPGPGRLSRAWAGMG